MIEIYEICHFIARQYDLFCNVCISNQVSWMRLIKKNTVLMSHIHTVMSLFHVTIGLMYFQIGPINVRQEKQE